MLSPIALFTYNRLAETRETLEALKLNDLAKDSDLFIFSDGPKNEAGREAVQRVRNYLETVDGFKSVSLIESAENKGLARSVIEGVDQVLSRYNQIIVLEDDLVTAPNFLNYMNEALDFYRHEQEVQSISAYSLWLGKSSSKYYFQTRPASWGWATWKDRWDSEIFDKKKIQAELDKSPALLKQFAKRCGNDISRMLLDSLSGKNDSWYVRWTYNHYKTQRYALYPARSFVTNIGHHENATHCKGINTYVSELVDPGISSFDFPLFQKPDQLTNRQFLNYFKRSYKLAFRIKLLAHAHGRKQLLNEIQNRLIKNS